MLKMNWQVRRRKDRTVTPGLWPATLVKGQYRYAVPSGRDRYLEYVMLSGSEATAFRCYSIVPLKKGRNW